MQSQIEKLKKAFQNVLYIYAAEDKFGVKAYLID